MNCCKGCGVEVQAVVYTLPTGRQIAVASTYCRACEARQGRPDSREKALEAAGIPRRFQGFDLRGRLSRKLEPADEGRRASIAAIKSRIARPGPDGRLAHSAYAYGPTGTYKTTALSAMFATLLLDWEPERIEDDRDKDGPYQVVRPRRIAAQGRKSGLWLTVQAFKDTLGGSDRQAKQDMRDKVRTVDLLLLDDFGLAAPAWVWTELDGMIVERHAHGRAMLVTSNRRLGDIAQEVRDITGDQNVGDRIRSRLLDMCGEPVEFGGADLRGDDRR